MSMPVMTRALGVVVLVLAVSMMTAVPSSYAGTFRTTAKWRSCDTAKSAISVRATFADPARYHGSGRYMVKKWIKWEYLKARGEWRSADRYFAETAWIQVTDSSWDFVSTAADRTGWGNLYYSRWRAHVTIKLLKNRPGPKDKTVDTIEIWPANGSFREVGSHCGYDF